MIFHLLLTSVVPPIPDNIKIIENWGEITLHTGGGLVVGTHVMVECTSEAAIDWLGGLNGFWLGVGAPINQQFEVSNVKKELT